MLTTIQRGINRTWTCVQSYYSAGAAANHARLTTDPHLLSSRIRWNNDAFQTCTHEIYVRLCPATDIYSQADFTIDIQDAYAADNRADGMWDTDLLRDIQCVGNRRVYVVDQYWCPYRERLHPAFRPATVIVDNTGALWVNVLACSN